MQQDFKFKAVFTHRLFTLTILSYATYCLHGNIAEAMEYVSDVLVMSEQHDFIRPLRAP